MPVEEIRVRLIAALKIFPKMQIAKLLKVRPYDITLFVQGRAQESSRRFGPMRLKRLAKICLQIETGELRHNGKKVGRGSKIFVDVPTKPPLVVHRVIFARSSGHPRMEKGTMPEVGKMPSFYDLFATAPVIVLPKLAQKR